MNIRRLTLPALLGLALMSPTRRSSAQKLGTVELGGFLQLDRVDKALQTKQLGAGAGGRVGVFLGPRWELEGDASFTQVEPRANRGGNPSVQTGGKKVQINYYVGRLNYNIPFGAKPGNAIIISGGAGANRVDKHTDLVLSPALGLRTMISRSAGFRFDVSSIISPNPASGTFKYPTLNNLNDGVAWGLLPLFFAGAGLSLGEVGLLAATYPGVWGLAQLATGAISDAVGRKPLIVAGMVLQACALAALVPFAGLRPWLAAMAALGLGTALVYPTLLAVVSDVVHSSERASATGVYRFWRDAGYLFGALLAGTLADRLGVSWAIEVVAALTLASGIVVLARLPETRRRR